jgi:hemerythrin-like domain-containing protein
LRAPAGQEDAGMSIVIKSLMQDHANMAVLMRAIERQIEGFAAGGDLDLSLLRDSLEYCAAFPETCHHPKEDLVLQQLRKRAPEQAEAVAGLEEEHIEIGKATKALLEMVDRIEREEELPRDELVSAGREYVENYRRHMAMEERALFQAADQALTPEDWLEVGEAIYQRMDPVFGARFSSAFDSLREDIAAAE